MSLALPPAPLLTVVTVVREAAGVLPRCLESVATQAYPNLEHLVVDGASTDGTVELLRRSVNPRLRWVSEPDAGLYHAMNKAVGLARGDWLLFLGADDVLRADLASLAPRLVDRRTIYYGDAWFVGAARLHDGPFDAAMLAHHNICHQAILYPRAAFERHRYDPRYPVLADWVLNMRCFSDRTLRFEYLPVVMADFEDRHGASSVHRDRRFERDYPLLVLRHFPLMVGLHRAAYEVAWRVARRLGYRPRRPASGEGSGG